MSDFLADRADGWVKISGFTQDNTVQITVVNIIVLVSCKCFNQRQSLLHLFRRRPFVHSQPDKNQLMTDMAGIVC